MKVVKSSRANRFLEISDVGCGHCFKDSDEDTCYIKTNLTYNDRGEYEQTLCVNLATGLASRLWSDTQVVSVDIKAVISPESSEE